MNTFISPKKIAHTYLLISILFFGYNMLELPKMPYFILRIIFMLTIVAYVFKIIVYNIQKKTNIRLFLCYFIYLIFSLIFYWVYDFPLELLPEALMDGLFPMLFFFVALDEKNKSLFDVNFYKYYFGGTIFLFICSIYLFITMPSWYIDWKISMQPDEWKENLQIIGTMSGFSGTGYLVGYTAYFSFCYLIFKFQYGIKKRNDIIFLCIVIFCLIFSQVRVALLVAIIVLLWYLKKNLSLKGIIIFITFLISFLYVFNYFVGNSEFMSNMFDIYSSKLEKITSDTRYQTGFTLLSHQSNYILGHGYGSGGNIANSLNLPSVTDAEYFKLFYETGIIGILLFITIILKTLHNIYVNKSTYLFEFFIIIFYLSAMFIANPLSISPMFSFVFWYAIGRVLL